MKIYKPTLQDLVAEAKPPIYIEEYTKGNQIMLEFFLSVTAFSKYHDFVPLEYVTKLGSCSPHDVNARKKMGLEIDKIREDMESRLLTMDIKFLNGIISDQPVPGSSYTHHLEEPQTTKD